MICPFCRKDYRDTPPGKEPSGFYHGDDHYYMNFRRYGYRCGNCGNIAEIIARPTGDNYLKRVKIPTPDPPACLPVRQTGSADRSQEGRPTPDPSQEGRPTPGPSQDGHYLFGEESE